MPFENRTALHVLLGAGAITAAVFSPLGDEGMFAIVLLGPLLTGIAAGAAGRGWRAAAAAWALSGLAMLVIDWVAYNEDQAFHAVLSVVMAALVAGGAGLGRSVRRLRRRQPASAR